MKYTSRIKFKGKNKPTSKLEMPSSLKEQIISKITEKGCDYLQTNGYDEQTFCSPTQSLSSKREKDNKSELTCSTETAIECYDNNLQEDLIPFSLDTVIATSGPYMNKTNVLYQMWLISHVLTLASFVCYFRNVALNKNLTSSLNSKFYVVCLLSSMSTYCFVLFRIYKIKLQRLLEQTSLADTYSTRSAIFSLGSLFQCENFHLVINCLLFLLNFKMQSVWKLLSFCIFSCLNLANFVCYELRFLLESKNRISVVEQVTETFKPFLNLVADPILCLVTFIDICQFGTIYVFDIKKAQSPSQKLLSQFTLLGYSINYVLRLEYVEKSRCTLNIIIQLIDFLVGEKLLIMLRTTLENHKTKANNNNKWYWHKKNKAIKAYCKTIVLLNKLWFDWARHGINIFLPIKNVDENILKNQIPFMKAKDFLSFKSFNSIK